MDKLRALMFPAAAALAARLHAAPADIADIHDAERLPGAFPWALPPVLIALAALFWLWRRWRTRKPAAAPTPIPARALTAEEEALARLEALERGRLAEAGKAREFAFALSEILRGYLAARHGIDALEATTTELLERAEPLPLGDARHDWLRARCRELDAVKFASAPLGAGDAARLLDGTRDFVRADAVPAAHRPEDA